MSKEVRKGSFEDLITRSSTGRGSNRMTMDDVEASVSVGDQTAAQFGLQATASVETAENEHIPFLRRCRKMLRRSGR